MEMLLPQVAKTGEFAQLTISTRESRQFPEVVNARFAFPRRTLVVVTPEGVAVLPKSNGQGGLPVMQLRLCQN